MEPRSRAIMSSCWHFSLLACAAVCLWAEPALATTTQPLPWEGALTTIVDSLTGPVAFAVSVLGVVVCGAMLIFGGDLQEFTRRVLFLVMAVALLMSASAIIRLLFGAAGATV